MPTKLFNYLRLKSIATKPELAKLLGLKPHFLTNTLYIPAGKNNYHSFSIDKRSGGTRTIYAPNDQLKDIQSRLSKLLLDCKQVILENNERINCLSHGFERDKSIITNAELHKNKKIILNIDLEDFFSQFNFGRVRGYFISNKDFCLDHRIATVIAQIACHEDMLPQGSPCSPVIANLMTNALDIRLARLAQRVGCSYTRYADDITFSTNKLEFPRSLVASCNPVRLGAKLLGEVRRYGLAVNEKKTRLQFFHSRHEITGLVANKKIGVRSEYWRAVRAMAYSQFKTGKFTIEDSSGIKRPGSIAELEGRLTFIDSIDRYNNVLAKGFPRSKFELRRCTTPPDYRPNLNSREEVYSRFLYYKWFFKSKYPTILTEGKTDNVYLKAALKMLRTTFPSIVGTTKEGTYHPKLNFPNLNDKTKYFLGLGGGAAHYIQFINRYKSEFEYFEGQQPSSPVILILDNDTGPKNVLDRIVALKGDSRLTVESIRRRAYLHVFYNLYLVLTPLQGKEKESYSAMEDLFYRSALRIKVDGKSFNKTNHIDSATEYGKHVFATNVVKANSATINFDKFKIIFRNIQRADRDFKRKYP